MSKKERIEYPIEWVKVYRNTAYLQAKNCLLCIHVGSVAVLFGLGTRPKGYGARLELFTPGRKFRVRRGSWYEMNYQERETYKKQTAKGRSMIETEACTYCGHEYEKPVSLHHSERECAENRRTVGEGEQGTGVIQCT